MRALYHNVMPLSIPASVCLRDLSCPHYVTLVIANRHETSRLNQKRVAETLVGSETQIFVHDRPPAAGLNRVHRGDTSRQGIFW